MDTANAAADAGTDAYDVLQAACPTRDVFGRLGERWTPLVVLALEPGALRFNAVRRQVQGVTQKMLTQTLRSLERDGLVHREVTPTVPVTVAYSLTPLGRSLLPAVHGLRDWAYEHVPAIERARAEYDVRTAAAPAR